MTGTQPHKQRPATPGAVVSEKTDPAAKSPGLSPKARQAIGIGGLILCLLIGGGIIYWFVIGSAPKQRTIKVDPTDQRIDTSRMGGGRAMVRPREARRIDKTDNRWIVRGTSGNMVVTQAGGKYTFNFGFLAPLLQPSQAALPAARFRILNDPAMAKAWDVTPEQLEKLKKLDVAPGRFKPTEAERASLTQLWTAYTTAADGQPKIDAQKKLLDSLDEIAKANLDSAKKSAVASVEQIRQVLTPEQVTKITK